MSHALSEQIAHSTVDLHLKKISEFLHGSVMNKHTRIKFSHYVYGPLNQLLLRVYIYLILDAISRLFKKYMNAIALATINVYKNFTGLHIPKKPIPIPMYLKKIM